jgi:hypothetical protein
MERLMLEPINLTYRGNEADDHRIDLIQVGHSLAGVGRLYNSVIHFYFHGTVPPRNFRPIIRTYTAEPTAGCVNFVLLASILSEHLPTYSEILFKFSKKAIAKLLGAIFAKRTGNTGAMEKALDVIAKMHEDNVSLMKTVVHDGARTKDQLIQLVGQLATNNRPAMADMVAPVGSSCRSVTHFDQTPERVIIDEPIAAVMRSKEDLEVGDQIEIRAVILGVDTVTGQCRVRFLDDSGVARGKITDPSLKSPHNVYTAALDTKQVVVLTAKPINRDGELTKLYISDARLS